VARLGGGQVQRPPAGQRHRLRAEVDPHAAAVVAVGALVGEHAVGGVVEEGQHAAMQSG
jgi:hypothetical protein